MTDLDAHDFAFLRDEHHDRWMGFERRAVSSWFHEAGLTDVRVDGLGDPCCATSNRGKDATVGIFMAVGRGTCP